MLISLTLQVSPVPVAATTNEDGSFVPPGSTIVAMAQEQSKQLRYDLDFDGYEAHAPTKNPAVSLFRPKTRPVHRQPRSTDRPPDRGNRRAIASKSLASRHFSAPWERGSAQKPNHRAETFSLLVMKNARKTESTTYIYIYIITSIYYHIYY